MGAYAISTGVVPCAKAGRVKMKRKMTPEAKHRIEYLRSHTVDITQDKSGQYIAVVREKRIDE